MIAAVRNPSGRFVGVHRTDLTPSGSDKAPIVPARAALRRMRGAGVHLGVIEDEAVVAEGIESALAGSLLTNGTPALAALGASGLRNLMLPALPRAAHVLIFADGDRAGREATPPPTQDRRTAADADAVPPVDTGGSRTRPPLCAKNVRRPPPSQRGIGSAEIAAAARRVGRTRPTSGHPCPAAGIRAPRPAQPPSPPRCARRA